VTTIAQLRGHHAHSSESCDRPPDCRHCCFDDSSVSQCDVLGEGTDDCSFVVGDIRNRPRDCEVHQCRHSRILHGHLPDILAHLHAVLLL
jgi:hypothetical protein